MDVVCQLIGSCCNPERPDAGKFRTRMAARSCPHPAGNRWDGLVSPAACAAVCRSCEHSIASPAADAPSGGSAVVRLMLVNVELCAACERYRDREPQRPCEGLADRNTWNRALAGQAVCPAGRLKTEPV